VRNRFNPQHQNPISRFDDFIRAFANFGRSPRKLAEKPMAKSPKNEKIFDELIKFLDRLNKIFNNLKHTSS